MSTVTNPSISPTSPKKRRWLRRVLIVLAVSLVAAGLWSGVERVWAHRARTSLAAEIDGLIDAKLASAGVKPAAVAGDSHFIRRVYLDLTGRVPPTDAVRRFLADTSPGKDGRLIHDLVQSRQHARWMADQWDGHLFFGGGFVNDQIDARPMTAWLENQFAAGRRWDDMSREILTASGRQHLDGQVTPFLTARKPEETVALMGRAFLGVRLDCAQCHDHPFAEFTQQDFWGMAAFFDKLNVQTGYEKFDNNEFMRAARDVGADVKVFESAEPVERKQPDRWLDVPPKFLRASAPAIAPQSPRRPVLAQWMTAPDNPYFAKAMVNRIWWQIFGVGLVTPYDDMRAGNPPTHPELLDHLARAFIDSGYDTRFITEAICNTRLYRRSSDAQSPAAADPTLYAVVPAKVMSPEHLFESFGQVIGEAAMFGRMRESPVKVDYHWESFAARCEFMRFFNARIEPEPLAFKQGIPQLLRLMNERAIQEGIDRAARSMAASNAAPQAVIEEMFLKSYARRPSEDEMRLMLDFVGKHQEDPGAGYRGVLWALLNSAEFLMRT